MIEKEHIKEYNKNGVVVIKSILDRSLLEDIKLEVQNIFVKAFLKNNILFDLKDENSFNMAIYKLFEISFNDFLGCAKAAQHILNMSNFASSSIIKEILNKLGLEHPLICVKPIIFFNSRHLAKEEAHFKTPAHQDWRSMQGSLNSIVLWIPLIDINSELGPVEFIKKSHLNELKKTKNGNLFQNIKIDKNLEKKFVSIPVEKGDLVIFSSFTIHRSGNNISEGIRWSMHFRYNDLNENSFIERGFPHPYKVYHPQKDLIHKEFPNLIQLKNTFNDK